MNQPGKPLFYLVRDALTQFRSCAAETGKMILAYLGCYKLKPTPAHLLELEEMHSSSNSN
jgi:hypothetical protein